MRPGSHTRAMMSTQMNFTSTANTSLNTTEAQSWLAPSLANFEFRDCAAIAGYWGDVVNLVNNNETGLDGIGNLDKLADFLESSLPPGWEPPPSKLHMISWYIYVMNDTERRHHSEWNDFFLQIDDKLPDCKDEFCGEFDVRGDPDVSGPGVSCDSRSGVPIC